jgi:hypothetical protein
MEKKYNKSGKLKPLKFIQFESIGEEYIYLLNVVAEICPELSEQPTIEDLRVIYTKYVEEANDIEKKYEKSSIYWTEVQEKAIVEYLGEVDEIKRNKIFSKKLYRPLKKLIENIIFSFKLFRNDVEISELQADCMSFLITKLDKFDAANGGQGFAYFGTIAKHYLRGQKKIAYKHNKSSVDIDESMSEASALPENIYELETDEDIDSMTQVFEVVIKKIEDEIKKPKMLSNDKKVGEAIIWVFKNHEILNVYNKNLIYHLIKERTGLQTKEITYSLGRFKLFYRVFKEDFFKNVD